MATVGHSHPDLHVLTGCTGVGKTELALAWAEQCGAEIVSCDSLLFYRGMDIGTAKPSPAERQRVTHHLIDLCEPAERMDVKTYVKLALQAVAEIAGRGRKALVVGGSGFYLRSFFAPVADDVPVDEKVRAGLHRRLDAEGLESLVAELHQLNPAGLGELDQKNPRRVLRALERCLVSGQTLRELGRAFAARPPPFSGRQVHLTELTREDSDLKSRIARRTAAMIEQGLIDEVRSLQSQGLEKNPSASSAIGYREVLAWIDSGGSIADLAEAINHNTWRLVRKQRTWFRRQLPCHRLLPLNGQRKVELADLFLAPG